MVPANVALSHHRPSSEANKTIPQLVAFDFLPWPLNKAIDCHCAHLMRLCRVNDTFKHHFDLKFKTGLKEA